MYTVLAVGRSRLFSSISTNSSLIDTISPKTLLSLVRWTFALEPTLKTDFIGYLRYDKVTDRFTRYGSTF